MSNIKSYNSQCTLGVANSIYGMVDAHACYSSPATWPERLTYVKPAGDAVPLKDVVERIPRNMRMMHTVDLGKDLVGKNTKMYNSNKGDLPYLDRNNMPSLIIAATLDMEFAHFDGSDGKTISCKDTAPFSAWAKQIEDTEMAVALNPLRVLPMFSYDPRRYRLPDAKSTGDNGACENWDKPFSRLIGGGGSESGAKIWLGFYMNPALGFRPFDEYREHLGDFYKECEKNQVPILARCVANGVIPGDVARYNRFDNGHREERKKKSAERHGKISKNRVPEPLCSDMYCGMNRIFENPILDQYYRNYGHPRNWVPVLRHFPELRLCLAGSGGNPAWSYISNPEWAKGNEMPGKDWVLSIVKLTRYKNVYADISGLDINNPVVRFALHDVMRWVKNDDEDFKHLKYKLIFGSDWYLTHLMDMGNGLNYSNYCSEFKSFFDGIDDTGKLWERVSLINPWNFYALSEDKIKKMCSAISKQCGDNLNTEMMEKMRSVLIGPNGDAGLAKYVSDGNNNDSFENAGVEKPKDDDEDLRPYTPKTDLCSIFAKFADESAKEKFYCFQKFHAPSGNRCEKEGDRCSDIYKNEVRWFHCADAVDDFSMQIDALVKEMWNLMDPTKRVDINLMTRNIKNRLAHIQLIKGGGYHCVRVNKEEQKTNIIINIERRGNDSDKTKDTCADIVRLTEPANIGDLLFALRHTNAEEDINIIEIKIKATLIHELYHVWQHIQGPNTDEARWLEEIDIAHTGGTTRKCIDIMLEVDAFEIQKRFEAKYLDKNLCRRSMSTNKFIVIDSNENISPERKIILKARYLWYDELSDPELVDADATTSGRSRSVRTKGMKYGQRNKMFRNSQEWPYID